MRKYVHRKRGDKGGGESFGPEDDNDDNGTARRQANFRRTSKGQGSEAQDPKEGGEEGWRREVEVEDREKRRGVKKGKSSPIEHFSLSSPHNELDRS